MENKEVFNFCYEDKFAIEDNEERRIFINCEIDENIIDSAVYHIMRYNRLDKDLPVNERKPILVYINTPGGNVVDGYGLVDAIVSSITPVYTINLAQCCSMGFLIFIAGHKRYSMPHAEFLLHDGSTAGWDSTAKMKDRMEFETIQLETMTREFILNHTKINSDLYNEKYRCEWYFLPDEGKSIGVVDYIVGKDCTIDDIT